MPCNSSDFLKKLNQIEELAQYALRESPSGLGRAHMRLIAGLARYLATEIELKTRRH